MKAGDLYTVAGALPVATAAGTNDGTRWVLTQHGDAGRCRGVAIGGAVSTPTPASDTVRVIGDGGQSFVSRFGRRTFLASSAGVAAGAAAVDAALSPAPGRRMPTRRDRGAGDTAAPAQRSTPRDRPHGQRPDRPGGDRPRRLLVRLDAAGDGPRRRRRRAYRIVVRRTDPGHARARLGQRARALGPAGLRRLRRPGAGRRRRLPVDRPVPGAPRARGAPCRPRPRSPPRSATATGRRSGCVPSAGSSQQPDRVDLPAQRGDAARRHRCRAPSPTSRPRTPTACSWTARRSTRGRASRIPTSSTCGPWT